MVNAEPTGTTLKKRVTVGIGPGRHVAATRVLTVDDNEILTKQFHYSTRDGSRQYQSTPGGKRNPHLPEDTQRDCECFRERAQEFMDNALERGKIESIIKLVTERRARRGY